LQFLSESILNFMILTLDLKPRLGQDKRGNMLIMN
jgi:hypothetical protein